MISIKPYVLFLLLAAVLVGCKHANDPQPATVPSPGEVILDVGAVQKNMAQQINKVLAARQDALAAKTQEPVPDILIGRNSITIKEVKPLMIGSTVLFGVTVHVAGVARYGIPENSIFTTDSTGTLIMPFVGILASGGDAMFSAEEKQLVMQNSIPKELASLAFKGTGQTDIVFLTDPFCYYCKKGYQFLSQHLDLIGEFNVAHMPSAGSPGSAAATWVICYAIEQGFDVKDVLEFTYGALEAPKANTMKAVSLLVLGQYQRQFPTLFKGTAEAFYTLLDAKYSQKVSTNAQALNNLGFNATPFFQVKGTVLRGFNQDALQKLIGG
ncbi:DsbA family protein [Pseudodesulfovibrio pelocollis]|uniref:DsbA family protein n=1 Tax=Pseudodesulfovibrio pelocollis TaxID=3051432 RepID=UPI00255B25D4|nr:hypothetical protein [Pseudodesulfovibrio sp. SB368]